MTYQIKILYDPPLKVIEIKTKVNKWDLIYLKKLLHSKETLRNPQNGGKWVKFIKNTKKNVLQMST